MYSLSDIYEKSSGATFLTITMGVVTSLLFTTGLFLILNSHSSSSSKQLASTISAIKKALSESGDSSNAALLSLEAALNEQDGGKTSSLTLPNTLTLSGLTVSGTSQLQGDVKAGKDLSVGGDLDTKGNASLESDLYVGGTSEFGDNITADGDLQVAGDLTDAGDTNLNTLETSSDVYDGGGLEVANNTQLDGDLTVSGDTNVNTLETGSDTYIGGDAEVSGATQLDSGLTVSGGTDTDTLTTTGDSALNGDLTVSGDTNVSTLETTSGVTDGGTLQVGGNSTLGTVDSQNQLLGEGDLQVYGDVNLGGAISYTFDTGNLITITDFTNPAWTSTGWTSTTTTAANNTGNTSALSTSQFAPTAGQTYQVNYTVAGSVAGQNPAASSTLTASFGGQTVPNNDSPFAGGTGSGTTESYIVTATSTAGLSFTPSSTFDGVVSGVSVKHVSAITAEPNDINFNFDGSQGVSALTIQGEIDNSGGTPSSYLDLSGDTNVEGNLTVGGTANISEINNDLEVDNTLTVDNDNGNPVGLSVTGEGDFDALSVDGNGDFDSLSIGGTDLSGIYVQSNTNATVSSLTSTHYLTVSGIINVYSTDGSSEKVGVDVDTACTGHLTVTQVYHGVIVGTNGCNTGTDLAEYYPSTQSLSPGDVVSIDTSNSQYVVKNSVADDNLAIGIVSTNPGETLGDSSSGYPIALSGRVPVNVTDEGGAIAPGDYLTTSSTPGYAMKAAPGDKTIGQAMESFNGTTGQVITFVNISPGDSTQNTLQATQAPDSGDANFTSLNVSGPSTLGDLAVTGTATVNNLTVTGISSVATLIVNGHVIGNGDTRGTVTVPAGQTTAQFTFAAPYAQTPAVVASPESQPVSFSVTPTAAGFNVNLASPAASDIKFDYLVEQ